LAIRCASSSSGVAAASPQKHLSFRSPSELALKREGPIPEFIELWLAREAAAAFLRLWALNVLPGLLQTYDYAHAMFTLSGLDEDEAAEKAAARIQRQAILDGPDATQVTAIIYEPVLHCLLGAPEIMAKQLTHILEMSRRPNLVIQVVRDTGYFPGRRHSSRSPAARRSPIPW
jgi:hypothetical protein